MTHIAYNGIASHFLIWGIVAHLVADWMLQNHWMATYKTSLKHPAAWVHSGIHLVFALLVFPWWGAAIIFVTHLLIDTRTPLIWWGNLIKQTGFPPIGSGDYPDRGEVAQTSVALSVAFWRDQVAHIIVIAIVSILASR